MIHLHPTVRAVVFDLEGTLVPPSTWHDDGSSRDPQAFRRQLAAVTPLPGACELLEALQEQVPLGVLTKMPSGHLNVVLETLFPRVRWSALLTSDDLEPRVPHPDGLELMAERFGLSDISELVYIGDGADDTEAAFHAGATIGLATWYHTDQQGFRLLPDAVLPNLSALQPFLAAPAQFFPPLESSQSSRHAGTPKSMIFRSISVSRPGGGTLSVNVLGRYFARTRAVRHLHNRHGFSQGIARKDEEGEFAVPEAWLPVLRALIGHMAKRHQVDAVTVIPAKRGRDPRLERLLGQIQDGLGGAWSGDYLPSLLRFKPDAQRVRYAGFEERYRRAAAGLDVVGGVTGRRVLVIDDVLTTGATLAVAQDKLLSAGAIQVMPFALTATIGDRLLAVSPEPKRCPRCGGRVHRMTNPTTGRPFLGCGRYRVNGCSYLQQLPP